MLGELWDTPRAWPEEEAEDPKPLPWGSLQSKAVIQPQRSMQLLPQCPQAAEGHTWDFSWERA